MKRLIALLVALFSFASVASTNMDASFMFGPSISQSGNIEDLGDPNMNLIFDFNYYFKESHGVGLSFGNEYSFDGSKEFPRLDDASMHTFEVHYSFRHQFANSNFKMTFSPGFGWQTLYDQYQDYYWGYSYYDDLTTAWIIDYKFMIDYIFFQEENVNFFAGVGWTQIMSMSDSLNGKDIAGTRTSGLARIGVGF
jgi:hypothetical protein